jgi:ATP-dependent DNA helicase RecG
MITKEELEKLLQDTESNRVERTISTKSADKFGQAICAFANEFPNNQKPGYLILGVNDDGSRNGLEVTDQLLQNLSDFRTQGNIVPPPALAVDKFVFEDGEVAVVEVQPHFQPPVRYKGVVWIRTGPRKDKAGEAEERILSEKRSSFAHNFDSLPCRESSLEDLSLDLFKLSYLSLAIDPEILAENHRDIKQQLASLKFYDLKADCPTYAGILLFGKNPTFYLPGAYIQYVKFDGKEMSDEVVFEKKFSGDLVSQLRMLDDFIKAQIIRSKPVKVSALKEEQRANYPEFALREPIMNAIIHRDYQSNAPIKFYEFTDRIEIQNPGGLYGVVNADNFPNANDYRNPNLAEAIKTLGYVNRFNIGVKKAISLLEKNGNPEPEFIMDAPTHFAAIIYN